jgi:predicted phosphodiesterase
MPSAASSPRPETPACRCPRSATSGASAPRAAFALHSPALHVQILSDLHFEFHADGGDEFVRSLDPTDIDVLVLAGDIAVGTGVAPALRAFCDHYARSTVVYVHGNHEFYRCPRRTVTRLTQQVALERENLVWLDASSAVIGGRRFLGGPLWFPATDETRLYRRGMADFDEIPGFETWVYRENSRMLALLDTELAPGDIVVSHHLPTHRSVAAKYSGSRLNCYFVCDVDDLIRERKPLLWIHGHTHSSVDARVGETRVVCNPFGYAGWELNHAFREQCVLEI